MDKKGLSLIELLGVIAILGIISTIAFFSFSKLIENSRRDAFASSATNFIEAARLDAATQNLEDPDLRAFYYVISTIENDTTIQYTAAQSDEQLNIVNPDLKPANLSSNRKLEIKEGAIKILFLKDKGAEIYIIQRFSNDVYYIKVGAATMPLQLPIKREQVLPINES